MTTTAPTALHPQRISVSVPLRTEDGRPAPIADLEPAIAVFHRCIQRGWLEGQLLDVADYRHVEDGPGVLLVGHDVDHGLSRDTLTVTRKRSSGDDAAQQVRDLLRTAAVAIEAFAYDGTLAVPADLSQATIALLDRALARDLGDGAATALAAAVAPAFANAWGVEGDVAASTASDPREAPTAIASVEAPVVAADVIERLGGSRATMQSPWDVTVEDFARRRDEPGVVVLDVREESEYETVNLGGTLVPLTQLPDRLDELDRDATTLVHCRAGIRGGQAVRILRDAGFDDAWNVNGALVAWADRIDPSTTRY